MILHHPFGPNTPARVLERREVSLQRGQSEVLKHAEDSLTLPWLALRYRWHVQSVRPEHVLNELWSRTFLGASSAEHSCSSTWILTTRDPKQKNLSRSSVPELLTHGNCELINRCGAETLLTEFVFICYGSGRKLTRWASLSLGKWWCFTSKYKTQEGDRFPLTLLWNNNISFSLK